MPAIEHISAGIENERSHRCQFPGRVQQRVQLVDLSMVVLLCGLPLEDESVQIILEVDNVTPKIRDPFQSGTPQFGIVRKLRSRTKVVTPSCQHRGEFSIDLGGMYGA